jgi:hypothetical protein
MSNRLLKRHKRQVLRKREHTKTSEPDLRTPEEIRAAKEASRPSGGWRGGPPALYSAPAKQGSASHARDSTTKADV